jgi:hypothetical protein
MMGMMVSPLGVLSFELAGIILAKDGYRIPYWYPCEGWVYHRLPLRRVGKYTIPLRRLSILGYPREGWVYPCEGWVYHTLAKGGYTIGYPCEGWVPVYHTLAKGGYTLAKGGYTIPLRRVGI